jgi:hypothetical protein
MAMIMKMDAEVTSEMVQASQASPAGVCPVERAVAAAMHAPLRDVLVGGRYAHVWAAGSVLEALLPANIIEATMVYDRDGTMDPFSFSLEFTDTVGT